MYAKMLTICLIVAVLPFTLASSYTSCTTAEDCKSMMKHEVKVQYYDAFTHMLEQTLYAIEDAVKVMETGLQTDDAKHTQLEEVKNAVRQQREILDNKGELNDDKVVAVYEKTQEYWRQIRKMNTDKKDIKSQTEHAEAEVKKMYKALFDTWTSAGALRGKIEIPGYDALDSDVQKAKDTPITDENMEFIIGTFTRIMNFYELRKLNVFTFM